MPPDTVIRGRLAELSELTGGYDFAEVIAAYWRGHDTGDEQLQTDAVRWLRGEFSTRTEARDALGVRTIVYDSNVHDQLKLLARFVRLAGYGGLLVCLDEMVNLYKLANTQARNANYEQLLRIVNDSLQGTAGSLGFVFGGTPDFLLDTRRGLYSYPALQSRLAENTFATDGLVDYSGPVLRLANLTPEDLYVLLAKLRHVYASGDPAATSCPTKRSTAYMGHCAASHRRRLLPHSSQHHQGLPRPARRARTEPRAGLAAAGRHRDARDRDGPGARAARRPRPIHPRDYAQPLHPVRSRPRRR